MSDRRSDIPLMGDMVFFFDEDNHPYVAFVAFVHTKKSRHSDRPVCNLATFKHDGRLASKVNVEPAYFDQKKGIWRTVVKWAWPDEIPSKNLNPLLSDDARGRMVGQGEYLPTV